MLAGEVLDVFPLAELHQTDRALVLLAFFHLRWLLVPAGFQLDEVLARQVAVRVHAVHVQDDRDERRVEHAPAVDAHEVHVVSQQLVEGVEWLEYASGPHHRLEWVVAEHEKRPEVIHQVSVRKLSEWLRLGWRVSLLDLHHMLRRASIEHSPLADVEAVARPVDSTN